MKAIKIKVRVREGDYGKAGRFEFPASASLFKMMEASTPEETKPHRLHYFNNVLVARKYSEDTLNLLKRLAEKSGFEVEFLFD